MHWAIEEFDGHDGAGERSTREALPRDLVEGNAFLDVEELVVKSFSRVFVRDLSSEDGVGLRGRSWRGILPHNARHFVATRQILTVLTLSIAYAPANR